MPILKVVDIASKTAEQKSLGIAPWKVDHELGPDLQPFIDLHGNNWRNIIDSARRSSNAMRSLAA